MKKLNFLALSLFLFASFLQAQTYQNTSSTIPSVDAVAREGTCGAATQPGVNMSSISVPITGVITDPSKITVNVAISADWLGDVVLELITPSLEAITLIRRIGASSFTSCGDSSSFVKENILGFNAANTAPINAAAVGIGVAIPAGNYAPTYGTAKFPLHHPGDMGAFLKNKQLNGLWRLVIYDYGLSAPTKIDSWQLVVSAGATTLSTKMSVFGSEVSLKQNPVEDVLSLDVNPGFSSLKLEIYDATGKLVKAQTVSKNAEEIQMDATQLASGLYFLVPIKDGEKRQTIKFLKK